MLPFVEVLEQAAVVQVQVEFRVDLLRRAARTRSGKNRRLAVGEVELFGVEQRLIGAVRGNRPLQRLDILRAARRSRPRTVGVSGAISSMISDGCL